MKFLPLILLFLIFLMALPDDAQAGCFPRKNLNSTISIENKPDCLEINIVQGCVGLIELNMENSCDYAFKYEGGDRIIELYNYENWIQHPEHSGSSRSGDIAYSYSDRTLPQDYTDTWQRTFTQTDDLDNKVIVTGKNHFVDIKKIYNAQKAIGLGIGVVISGFVIYLIFVNRRVRHIN